MTLHPQAQTILDLMNAAPAVAPEDLTPQDLRTQYAGLAMAAEVPGVTTEDRTIPGPATDLPIRIYRPEGAGVTPVVVYFHGGGWVIGDIDTHDGGCRSLALASGCTLVSVDYRLAPEWTFPAPVEDCFAATLWVQEHADELLPRGQVGETVVAPGLVGEEPAEHEALGAQRVGHEGMGRDRDASLGVDLGDRRAFAHRRKRLALPGVHHVHRGRVTVLHFHRLDVQFALVPVGVQEELRGLADGHDRVLVHALAQHA